MHTCLASGSSRQGLDVCEFKNRHMYVLQYTLNYLAISIENYWWVGKGFQEFYSRVKFTVYKASAVTNTPYS